MLKKIISFILLIFFITLKIYSDDVTSNNIAVLNFDNKGVDDYIAEITAEIFNTELFKSGYFSVIERNQISKVINEQKFQISGLTESEIAKLGSLLSVQYLVVGSVGKIGTKYIVNAKFINAVNGKIIMADSVSMNKIEDIETKTQELARKMVKSLIETTITTKKEVKPEKPAVKQEVITEKKEEKPKGEVKKEEKPKQEIIKEEKPKPLPKQPLEIKQYNNIISLEGSMTFLGNTTTNENNYYNILLSYQYYGLRPIGIGAYLSYSPLILKYTDTIEFSLLKGGIIAGLKLDLGILSIKSDILAGLCFGKYSYMLSQNNTIITNIDLIGINPSANAGIGLNFNPFFIESGLKFDSFLFLLNNNMLLLPVMGLYIRLGLLF